MSSVTFALECPVCLDTYRHPVVPPCGHLICEQCIILHISFSTNHLEARCPTCRAPFPTTVTSLIQNEYHVFVNPPLRRVYLGDRVDNSKAVINDLKSKVVCLEAHIEILKSGNESTKRELCLMLDKAKEYARLALYRVNAAAQLALDKVEKEARLASDKANKGAQLALDKAKDDLRLANLSLEECRAENNALKYQVMRYRWTGNTSGQSIFDTPPKDTSPRCDNRTIKSLPERVQLPSADQSSGYSCLANDMRLTLAARDALAALLSSPTPPSAPSAQSGSSIVSTGGNMASHATNQVTAATTSVAGENSATSSTPILDRSPTPPLLYPYPVLPTLVNGSDR